MRCPTCLRRRVATGDTVCRTCRTFIREFIDTGLVSRARPGADPMVADVLLVMRRLDVDQTRALAILGAT